MSALCQHERLADLQREIHSCALKRKNTIIVYLDHKNKILARELSESQLEYFGKTGMPLLGPMFLYASKEEEKFECSFLDMVLDIESQDSFNTFTTLELIVEHIKRTFPGISNVVLTSDNATTFATDACIPFIVEHNAYMHAESGIWISRCIRTEPQNGKDLLDTHFAYVNKQITKYVLHGVENAVNNANQIFSALTLEGGLPNTTTAIVRVDRSACAAVRGKLLGANMKGLKHTGSRKVQDLVFHKTPNGVDATTGLSKVLVSVFEQSGLPSADVLNHVMSRNSKDAAKQKTKLDLMIISTHGAELIREDNRTLQQGRKVLANLQVEADVSAPGLGTKRKSQQ